MRSLFKRPNPDAKPTIEDLQADSDVEFLNVYKQYRKRFISWGKANSKLNEADLEDAFQDSVLVLFKRINEIDPQKSVAGFLKNTFKFKIMHKQRDRNLEQSDEAINEKIYSKVYDNSNRASRNEDLKHLFKVSFQELGEPCYGILKLKFYHGFESASIAERLGYKNATVVHSKTNTCLKKLRAIVEDKI